MPEVDGRPPFFFGIALLPDSEFPPSSDGPSCDLPTSPWFAADGASSTVRSARPDPEDLARFLGGGSSRCGGVVLGAAHQSEGRERFLFRTFESGACAMLDIFHWKSWVTCHLSGCVVCGFRSRGSRISYPPVTRFVDLHVTTYCINLRYGSTPRAVLDRRRDVELRKLLLSGTLRLVT